jgi:hydrogenase maturation factor HypF (carbamoyltransferase family)
MCDICKGTHVVHAVGSYSIQFSCCPVCGPEPDDVWRGNIQTFLQEIERKKEALLIGHSNN